jgi:hypothetical protein
MVHLCHGESRVFVDGDDVWQMRKHEQQEQQQQEQTRKKKMKMMKMKKKLKRLLTQMTLTKSMTTKRMKALELPVPFAFFFEQR